MNSKFLVWMTMAGLLSGMVACKKQGQSESDAGQSDPSVVMVSDEFLPRLQLADVLEGKIAESLRVPGRIDVDEQRVARIGAAVTGRVTQVSATLGQRVRNGEVLATLHSSELSTVQLAYLKAMSQAGLQQKAVERAKLLYASDVIGAAELQKRESEYAQAQSELKAMHDQLRALGMTEASIQRLEASGNVHSQSFVTSTLDGVVIERKLTQGQVVQPSDLLFTVADLSHVWLVAEVPEQQAASVRRGEMAQAEVPALGGEKIRGKLIFVADIVNPDTRTVTVRMDVNNPKRNLKPEMLASMIIEGAPVKRMIVPATAIIREENLEHVFVQLDNNRFQLRKISTGPGSNGKVSVLSGLKPGEKVVTEGAFHLNNERKRKELEG